jgi:ribosome biogenesis protein YTM1
VTASLSVASVNEYYTWKILSFFLESFSPGYQLEGFLVHSLFQIFCRTISQTMAGSEVEEAIEQIRISFRLDPSVKDASLQVPKESIAVPANIRRTALSTVINHLLDRHVDDDDEDDDNEPDESDGDEDSKKLQAISFDFLIGNSSSNNQQLLRTSVQTAAKRLGLSLERDIILTYFPALQAPELANSSPKIPDWISCMSSLSTSSEKSDRTILLCTGSYDGNVRVYNTTTLSKTKDVSSLEPIASLLAHQGPIKCLALTTSNDEENHESFWIATGSLDQTLVVQQYHAENKSQRLIMHCQEGHTSSIGSVAFPRQGDGKPLTLASGDWDGGLCIWDLQSHINLGNNNPAEELPPRGKKQKSTSGIGGKHQEEPASITATPKFAIQAHASQISGMCWNSSTADSLITGSWDHSLKVWQVERQDCVLTLNGSRVVTCLDVLVQSPSVVVTGHPDCTIRLWDVRNPQQQQADAGKDDGTSLVVSDNTTLKPSHKAWITQVQWSRQNPYQLASTSHDGTLKLWDIRSTLPLSTVRVVTNQQEKALCLCYEDTKDRSAIFTGGTDGIVNQYYL